MNFKAYDILSSLVPGFLIFLTVIKVFNIPFEKDLIVPYTAVAFLFGYLINTLSSWLEDFYFFTWGGKPSSNLLEGKGIWKVSFYHSSKAKELLTADGANVTPSSDELFAIAMRNANGEKDTRVDDFNAQYAFSRVLLTTVIIATIILLIQHYSEWQYYAVLMPITLIIWLRAKQRGYYYAREVLNVYLKKKQSA